MRETANSVRPASGEAGGAPADSEHLGEAAATAWERLRPAFERITAKHKAIRFLESLR